MPRRQKRTEAAAADRLLEQEASNLSGGDDCWCISTDKLYYKSRVISTLSMHGERLWAVHFDGWNARHDDKVPIGCLLPMNARGTAAAHAFNTKTTLEKAAMRSGAATSLNKAGKRSEKVAPESGIKIFALFLTQL